jgi:uncharacterized protein YdaU (DUF1376 family)
MPYKPYMPFYTADYMNDTAHLSMEEHGAYLLLIIHYWHTEKPIPADEKSLSQICRTTLKGVRRIKLRVSLLFSQEGNTWVHKRIEKELAEYRHKLYVAREKGKNGANKRWSKKDATAMPQLCHSYAQANAQAMPNDSYTDTDTDTYKQEVIDNKSTTTTVVGKRKFFVDLLGKYFSSDQIISMLRSATGQSMLTAWVEADVPEKAVTSVLDDWLATGQPLNNPAYYRAQILTHGKTPIKAPRRRVEETPEEYDARIKIKAQEATEATLKAIADMERAEERERCRERS